MLKLIGVKTRGQMEEEWAAVLRKHLKQGDHGRPEGTGWRTLLELAAENGIQRAQMSRRMLIALDAGDVEMQMRRIGVQWTKFYRPKTSAKRSAK